MTAANSPTLVKDLQKQVKLLTGDLRTRSDDPTDVWGQELKTEYLTATERGRTGLSWSEWRDGEVDLAAVAWVLATVFIRFCEDNDLIDGPWITGEGPRHGQAADNETAYYQAEPSRNARDWLRAGFTALASLPAGRSLLDPHNLVWRAPISADAAQQLLAFWRQQANNGSLVLDLTDPELDTRFLGDLYQDLSDHAKKKYALLQTPVFVEEFILDRTLTPAIAEFGLDGLKLIDPTCGSGHFLLGAFDRLLAEWQLTAPAMDTRERVQKALDSVNGVDINPFAVAIARFRITVSALRASGFTHLKDAPAYRINLATGDSLLYGLSGRQGDLLDLVEDDGAASFTYANEDVAEHRQILDRGSYHVVVGNPPYITVKDKAHNELYRAAYKTCHRQYALSVPFMELFFELAKKGASTTQAGYVGQITSNSFMKREFGSKVIEELLSGEGSLAVSNPVDLQYVIDTSGAYIPGHGTPTVILIGRHRRPQGDTLRAVLGVKGEPGRPADPAHGVVWTEICDCADAGDFNGRYVTARDLSRVALARHPWSLSGGSAGDLKTAIESAAVTVLADVWEVCGYGAITGEDDAFTYPRRDGSASSLSVRPYIRGEDVRDFSVSQELVTLWPYSGGLGRWTPDIGGLESRLWPLRALLRERRRFGVPVRDLPDVEWFEFREPYFDRLDADPHLSFAEVASHNHVVIGRGDCVFVASAPIIKLPLGVDTGRMHDLLGILNSSAACFWLKQVCHQKGGGLQSGGGEADQPWSWNFQFNGTKWQEFPLPAAFPRSRGEDLDSLSQEAAISLPAVVLRREGVSGQSLEVAHRKWDHLRARMIFEQEELDWEAYRLYGLIDEDLAYLGGQFDRIVLGQRSFEIALARKVADGSEETAWFARHGSVPLTNLPSDWPADYAAIVHRRLDLIASDPFIGLLERPEYKRRWAGHTWEQMEESALRDFILDTLEKSELWSDASGPGVLSVAQLADRVRGDVDVAEAVRLLRGAVEVDLTAELGSLLADEAVPSLAAQRYKESGLRKRAEWESVWDLQRREDAGERPQVPVPPKYQPVDFTKASFWQARGKLDVPKERFVSYPGAGREGDGSLVIGWARWDHLEQARALARLIMDRTSAGGWPADRLLPLLAGLAELEPWLHQWHDDPDPLFGGSPAVFMSGFIDDQLSALGKTRDDCKAWRP